MKIFNIFNFFNYLYLYKNFFNVQIFMDLPKIH